MSMSYREKLEEISEVKRQLFDGGYINQWEYDFCRDVMKRDTLSDKQKDVIDRIYDKACKSPY